MNRTAAPANSVAGMRDLAGYRLLRSLGKGGLGEVFEAAAPDGSIVALKAFLLREDDQGLAAAAFVREASLGQRLQHPDVVRVLDRGSQGEYAYLVMEFVPGHDLRRHVPAANRLPLPLLLRTGSRVAGALAAAHAIHVIHRDIKPGNVLVHWPSDTVKVADFGLARLGDAFRSRTGVVAGTPGYMAPEQLAEGVIGPYTDLYSLGVTLFELISGRLPFEARSLGALLSQVANRTAPTLQSLLPQVPPAVSALVAELLERRPAQRPADAAAVAERLLSLSRSAGGGPKSRG
ncbi:MAG: serine/threonine protein kinase [Proteobacteria bacterium]|nr:serine/threonine protein kinase [Pseudomonadota bacterium]